MDTTIKAIETRYKGYRFRSRLEARWAVFFDALGIKWEYEKEGYDLGEAGWYLPDFRLHNLMCRSRLGNPWIEIKSSEPNNEEFQKAHTLYRAIPDEVYIACGEPRIYSDKEYETDDCILWEMGGFGDRNMAFMICLNCGQISVNYPFEGSYRVCDRCGYDALKPDHQWLIAAVNAARSARFEHGESGAK